MAHTPDNKVRNAALIALALAALTCGCGDSLGGRSGGSAFGASLASHIEDQIGGPPVELTIYTGCEGMGSKNLDTRCEGVRSADIEVFLDRQSLIFDFSNAPKRGVISDASFEGYVLSIRGFSGSPTLLDATVDTVESTVDASAIAIELDSNNVAVDFRGLDYHDATFVKVDLTFVRD